MSLVRKNRLVAREKTVGSPNNSWNVLSLDLIHQQGESCVSLLGAPSIFRDIWKGYLSRFPSFKSSKIPLLVYAKR